MVNFSDGVLYLETFFVITIGIVVLFVGRRLNAVVPFFTKFSIPDAVTGGLLFSVIFSLVYVVSGVEIQFNLTARDALLVYFFTTIGINSSLKDLRLGGKPLLVLLAITIGYMFLQNFTGVGLAALMGQPMGFGLVAGTVSLIGGHGTTIAWAPKFVEAGIGDALEVGIAAATFGLILASIMGGPIAHFLIKRYKLKPRDTESAAEGIQDDKASEPIEAHDYLDAMLVIHVCILVGLILNGVLAKLGLDLPAFVGCLFAGIIMTNTIPKGFPRLSGSPWPARSPALALIADMSLGAFLAMSLMSMQLWTLVDLAGPLFIILGGQVVISILVNLFIVFPAMGKTYDAAVICAGFGGISLGSTPTAMANMGSVTQRYGASKIAFIVVPLVCAFFIDLANALMIPGFLSHITDVVLPTIGNLPTLVD